MSSVQNSGYQPQAQKELTWTTVWMILYIMTWHPCNFNSNNGQWPDSVHPPCTFWRNQGHHVSHLKYDFVQSISLPKKMKAFDFVLVLSEGHKEWCQTTGCRGKLGSFLLPSAIWYWDICGGSGPLLESCRPQLRVHKMVHTNPWECLCTPTGCWKNGSCTKWSSPCWFGMIWMCTKWFAQPPYAISVQSGVCWFDVNSSTKWIFVGCSKSGPPTLLHQSSWSQISLYRMSMTNP